MALITPVTKYLFKGVEYNSLKEIKEVIHDTIGLEVLDKVMRVCPPQKHKDLHNLLDLLCSPEVRKVLIDCYSNTFEEVDDFDNTSQIINVLDIK